MCKPERLQIFSNFFIAETVINYVAFDVMMNSYYIRIYPKEFYMSFVSKFFQELKNSNSQFFIAVINAWSFRNIQQMMTKP